MASLQDLISPVVGKAVGAFNDYVLRSLREDLVQAVKMYVLDVMYADDNLKPLAIRFEPNRFHVYGIGDVKVVTPNGFHFSATGPRGLSVDVADAIDTGIVATWDPVENVTSELQAGQERLLNDIRSGRMLTLPTTGLPITYAPKIFTLRRGEYPILVDSLESGFVSLDLPRNLYPQHDRVMITNMLNIYVRTVASSARQGDSGVGEFVHISDHVMPSACTMMAVDGLSHVECTNEQGIRTVSIVCAFGKFPIRRASRGKWTMLDPTGLAPYLRALFELFWHGSGVSDGERVKFACAKSQLDAERVQLDAERAQLEAERMALTTYRDMLEQDKSIASASAANAPACVSASALRQKVWEKRNSGDIGTCFCCGGVLARPDLYCAKIDTSVADSLANCEAICIKCKSHRANQTLIAFKERIGRAGASPAKA
jgi:hypothetical protein